MRDVGGRTDRERVRAEFAHSKIGAVDRPRKDVVAGGRVERERAGAVEVGIVRESEITGNHRRGIGGREHALGGIVEQDLGHLQPEMSPAQLGLFVAGELDLADIVEPDVRAENAAGALRFAVSHDRDRRGAGEAQRGVVCDECLHRILAVDRDRRTVHASKRNGPFWNIAPYH